MAGGSNASATACLRCAERADRLTEGLETDFYQCTSCGYSFGIDFDQGGPPSEPMWPISPISSISSGERGELLKTVRLMVHHRGQFSVYLRLLDVAVPGSYGPTADEVG